MKKNCCTRWSSAVSSGAIALYATAISFSALWSATANWTKIVTEAGMHFLPYWRMSLGYSPTQEPSFLRRSCDCVRFICGHHCLSHIWTSTRTWWRWLTSGRRDTWASSSTRSTCFQSLSTHFAPESTFRDRQPAPASGASNRGWSCRRRLGYQQVIFDVFLRDVRSVSRMVGQAACGAPWKSIILLLTLISDWECLREVVIWLSRRFLRVAE